MLVVMKRLEPEENMDRWYLVTIQATLFAPVAVVTAWGSNQTAYQQMRASPAGSVAEATSMADEIVRAKLKRGYAIVIDDRPAI